jgi:hypothetical protein
MKRSDGLQANVDGEPSAVPEPTGAAFFSAPDPISAFVENSLRSRQSAGAIGTNVDT